MGNKEISAEIYAKHLHLASTDGRLFRKTVMDEIMERTQCSLAASATYYNNCKKAAPVEGLGRAPAPKGVQKPGSKKPKADDPEVADDDCFSVLELVQRDGNIQVGRCQSFVMQGDASEKFDDKVVAWPTCSWVMIKGLGPNSGDTYKLGAGEKEIKRYGEVGLKQMEEVAV